MPVLGVTELERFFREAAGLDVDEADVKRLEPTNLPVTIPGMHLVHTREGRIAESRAILGPHGGVRAARQWSWSRRQWNHRRSERRRDGRRRVPRHEASSPRRAILSARAGQRPIGSVERTTCMPAAS
jgi:hypothetical protein